MINLNELARGGTICTSTPGLAIGDGAKTGPAVVATCAFAIKGIIYTRAGAATVAPLTAATAQGLLTTCLYLICLDSSGTLSSVKGTAVLSAALAAGTAVLHWPTPAADTCPIGAIKVVTANAANFTAGTTALDATDVTETYYNLLLVPEAPLTS